MSNAMMNPEETYRMPPELLEVTTRYLETASIEETASTLDIPVEKVVYYLNKKESKRFIDTIFLEQGYINRTKLQSTLDTIIDKKLLELEEAELTSNKDIADLLTLALKMRESFVKDLVAEPKETQQTNVQVNGPANFGLNYNNLLTKLIED